MNLKCREARFYSNLGCRGEEPKTSIGTSGKNEKVQVTIGIGCSGSNEVVLRKISSHDRNIWLS